MTATLPLVGRDREIARLQSALDAALDGHGAVALISGEAGIGKTTLAEQLCQSASPGGALVLTGRCYDLTETAPFAPWIELFSAYPAIDGLPDIPASVARCEIGGGVASQTALFATIHAFLAEVAAVQPLVLLLDDQHWADEASLDLLRFLARQTANLPLLILVTYRAMDLAPTHHLTEILPLLTREARALRLNLQPLASDDLWAMIRPHYRLGAEDEVRLTSYLQHRTEGNPFFAVELLQTLEEDGVLQPDGSAWVLGDLGNAGTPILVEHMVGGRLAQLSAGDQELLAVAAVLGQEVPLRVWSNVAETGNKTLLELLDRASRARLMTETPDGRGARFVHALVRQVIYGSLPPSRRRQWHQKAGTVLAATADPDPDAVANHFRRSGDPRAAEWLIRAGDRAERVYSWQAAAERFEAAVESLRESSDDAEKTGWLLVRIARMRRYAAPALGLEWLDEAGRFAESIGNRPLVATVMRQSGLLHCMQGNVQHGITLMERGVAALAALTPAEHERFLASESIAGFVPDAHQYRGTLALWLAFVGRYTEAMEYAAPYISQDAVPEGDDGNYGDAFDAFARAHAMLGNPEEARAAYARARLAYGDSRHDVQMARTTVDDLHVRLLTYEPDNLAERRWLEEQAEAAWKRASGALADSSNDAAHLAIQFLEGRWAKLRTAALAIRAHGTLTLRAKATYWLGLMARACGDIELAWQLVEDALHAGTATEPGTSLYRTAQCMQRLAAELAIDAGDFPTARRWLEACERWLAWNGAVPGRAENALGWATYHRASANLDQARRQAALSLQHASTPRQPLALLAARRMLGELDTADGQYDAAATHLEAALTLAEACVAPYERALTMLALAELDLAQDAAGYATTRLAAARSIFESLDAMPALNRANALADRLEIEGSDDRAVALGTFDPPIASDRDRELLTGLSRREIDILQLLPAGHTNREIADLLFLSQKTVENHIGRIFAKTNLPNRAAAAAFAQRVGLA